MAPGVEVLELPGFAGGIGDEAADAEFAAQIVDPAGHEAGLDDDDAELLLVEQLVQFGPGRVEGSDSDRATSWEVSGPSHPDVLKPWAIFAQIHDDETKVLHYFVTQKEAYSALDQLIDAIAQGVKKYSLPEEPA